MMENYLLRCEFRRRLIRVRNEINKLLVYDSTGHVPTSGSSLLPALFSLYTYMWCTRWRDMIRIVK